MKKRHLKDIDAEERVDIAEEYDRSNMFMVDIASKHHVDIQLVSRICKDFKNGGAHIAKKKSKEAAAKHTSESIQDVICQMLDAGKPIWCSKIIQEKLMEGY